jgi:chromosome partitioning protein
MGKIIAINNAKGGVGKTTTAAHVAHAITLRNANFSVLLADFDPQGQCSVAFGVNQEPGVFNTLVNPSADVHQWIRKTGRDRLDLLPGDRSTATAQIVLAAENRPMDIIHRLFKPLLREYDFVIFDTAPSAGGIQERAIFAADAVLVPTATEFMSMDGLNNTLKLLAELQSGAGWKGKLFGILPTFFDESTKESAASYDELRKSFSGALLQPIHRATILRECAAESKTVFELKPDCRSSQEYEALCTAVLRRA